MRPRMSCSAFAKGDPQTRIQQFSLHPISVGHHWTAVAEVRIDCTVVINHDHNGNHRAIEAWKRDNMDEWIFGHKIMRGPCWGLVVFLLLPVKVDFYVYWMISFCLAVVARHEHNETIREWEKERERYKTLADEGLIVAKIELWHSAAEGTSWRWKSRKLLLMSLLISYVFRQFSCSLGHPLPCAYVCSI